MRLLSIESSCDETAAAIAVSPRSSTQPVLIASSIIASQAALHAETGGVVPEVAARAHVQAIIPTIKQALAAAKLKLSNIDAIAVTAGPGLQTSLMVGVDTAKALAYGLHIPLVAVNHLEGHAFSALMSTPIRHGKTLFPAIALVVSGGHTELILINDWLNYKKIGHTLDDAAGECFDKVAKLLGLPYPGGPALSQLALRGSAQAFKFPRPMIKTRDFNFSFSGLKTAVLYELLKIKRKTVRYKADIAASVQQAIVDVLVAKTHKAAERYKVKTLLLGGGVAANELLRKTFARSTTQHNRKLLITPKAYCTDNAAMIAFVGTLRARKRQFIPWQKLRADANWELREC